MAPAYSLEGKVAIVTGGASGIGLATAKAFLAAGALGVTLVDLKEESLSSAAASLSVESSRVLTVAADVSDEAAAASYVRQTVDKWGRLDVSVQCAGISPVTGPVTEMDVAAFDTVIRVNLRGVFLGLQQSLKAMLASPSQGQGCSVVLISSQLGLDGFAGSAAYCASKFGVRGLMASAAQEVGPKGIRVNAVAPGPIETPMLEGFRDTDHVKKGNIPRAGYAEEIANAVLFLASDAGSYCSGTTLKVDGGWSKWC
ncbi:SDR family NAD(P)-dependent oxidoreductase [Rhodotorula paludigena]|uniref:SDR family NAD(P)-dependent oxidoreductase n=1 Tax=Rhodotorula paludigena TaxID=86838 RepID=UPI00316D6F71